MKHPGGSTHLLVVEADGGCGGDEAAVLEPGEDCGLAGSVQTHQDHVLPALYHAFHSPRHTGLPTRPRVHLSGVYVCWGEDGWWGSYYGC